MWMAADVRVHGYREHEFFFLAVEVVELVFPQVLNVPWVDPAVRVRGFLDEHHLRLQVSGYAHLFIMVSVT